MSKRVLTFDLGASGGRAVIVSFDGTALTTEEVHRFSNDPVMVRGTFYWDVLRLFHEIKQGILKAKLGGGFGSVAINTWGVDFGLLDENGELLQNPVHYRDTRTQGMLEEAKKIMDSKELYLKTGNQIMEINTLFQLLAIKHKQPELLKRAKKLLFMPDLLAYFLTGRMVSEYSIATTSQLFDQSKGEWNYEVIDAFGFDRELFAPVIRSGQAIGRLSDEICEELGVKNVPVIAVCGHDTQDAVAGVPTDNKDFAFLSCGTWSLLGTERMKPIINDTTAQLNLTNEGGFGGTTTILNNIVGLWLIQECKRQWERDGKEYSYADLEKMAREAEDLGCMIDPDDKEFATAGDIPGRIRTYCAMRGQSVPDSDGDVVRCIYQSLALKYSWTLEKLKECTDAGFDTLYVVGGGAQDTLLCQMAADCCNMTVMAGPVEATVYGNAAIQLIALGELDSISKARAMIRQTADVKTYTPDTQSNAAFAQMKEEFASLLG